MTIKVLLVDDYEVVRRGLRRFLALDSELEIIGEASNGAEALELARQLKPDVVLMDLIMPGLDGIRAIATLRQELPQTEVVALTSLVEDRTVVEVIGAGAIGYLVKDAAPEALCQAIKAAAAGQVQLSPQVVQYLVRHTGIKEPSQELTRREIEVLELIAGGKVNKEIARTLGIGEETVKFHVSNLLSKLAVTSRTQAALYALRAGLIKPL